MGFHSLKIRLVICIIAATLIAVTSSVSCTPTPNKPIIRIASVSWQSNVPVINIIKILFEDELGYEVEFIPTLWGPDTFAALAKEPPDVDVYAEAWLPNGQDMIDEYVLKKEQVEIVSTSYTGRQGFVVPTYLIEGDPDRNIEAMAPDLHSVEQLNDYISLFDRDHDGRGELFGGPEGWTCTGINEWQLESWQLNYNQIIQDEWMTWSLITSAYQEGEPILCYCYEPTWPTFLFGLTWLEAPTYSDEAWADYEIWRDWKAGETVIWDTGTACGYPPSEVLIVVTDEFNQEYPRAYGLLQNWSIPVEDVAYLSVQIELQNLPADYVAIEYIKEHPDLIQRWLYGIE